MSVAEHVRNAALALGFARVGFTPVEPLARGEEALRTWIAAGRHGEMDYMANGPRGDVHAILAEARSIIIVALPYARPARLPIISDTPRGIVARYARGDDYHLVFRGKLRALGEQVKRIVGRDVLTRSCVDSAPLLEREAAARAGVGFIAKNTMLIAPGLGSDFLLGELLVDVELTPDAPIEGRCGRCRACLDACPTGAFVDAYTLDARRCISYLTIELRGRIPRELRPLMGQHVFGCDICQDVCPFNASQKQRGEAPELAPREALVNPELVTLLTLGSKAHRRLVKDTALHRVSRNQLARNAAVALGNAKDARAIEPLAHVLATHVSEIVREHAAWALGRLGGALGEEALRCAAAHDLDEGVRAEARMSLRELSTRDASS